MRLQRTNVLAIRGLFQSQNPTSLRRVQHILPEISFLPSKLPISDNNHRPATPDSMIVEYNISEDNMVANKPQPAPSKIINRGDPAMKPTPKEKPPNLAEVLKGSHEANTLTNRLLNQKLEITIRELLATTPEIERILTKALSEGESCEGSSHQLNQ